ncbi:type IX secretion system anionic LPS delivery protein PorZ [Ochrovirga pacifica]|uniref:type IX secretion system anionic LPS delivery protein PorZ n=1 Tax=Ochrovirga pacifica TaxID=1042376 RepID=UPI0002559213|nr:T9SS type A sorting domain-containing protein [Ochrovirga pacifica]
MKYIYFFLILATGSLFAQRDFSENWQDLYSYNQVKDFTIVNNQLVAITENALFIADLDALDTPQKFSSVNGLSGETTSSIGYDSQSQTILVGYQNGLIELITNNNQIYPITGIRDNLILVGKQVYGFYTQNNTKYVYGDFGIVELNIDKKELGNSYRLNNSGLATTVNALTTQKDVLLASTSQGLYGIDLSTNSNPINFDNWNLLANGQVSAMIAINDEVYFTKNNQVFSLSDVFNPIFNASEDIVDLQVRTGTNQATITTRNLVTLFDVTTNSTFLQVNLKDAASHTITTQKAVVNNNHLYLATQTSGVLTAPLNSPTVYTEIHPQGPVENSAYSVSVHQNQIWIAYGGANEIYDRFFRAKGLDFFDGNQWQYIARSQAGNLLDLTKAIVDPNRPERVLVASYDKGIAELENQQFKIKWDDTNTNQIIPDHRSNASLNWEADLIVDKNNIIWVANARGKDDHLFSKFDSSRETWTESVQFKDYVGNGGKNSGLNKMFVDNNNYVFAGSRTGGVLVFNANGGFSTGNRPTGYIDSRSGYGSLVSSEVFSAVADENQRVWIGTNQGLMVFDDYQNLFSTNKQDAKRLLIEEGGVAKEFLADVKINEILIDNSGNKWFATDGAGLVYTSSDAQTTLAIFNKANSPLPSNKILDLELDKNTGKIYIVTDKGVVSYTSGTGTSSFFGDKITEVVAYPNPAIANKKGHSLITIVAKDGNGIPEGTNVKIMDVSGRLVYETNVEVASAQGGKVVWNKRNLRGTFVTSGVYIVLVSSPDGSEHTTTKIAIVN